MYEVGNESRMNLNVIIYNFNLEKREKMNLLKVICYNCAVKLSLERRHC